MSTPAKKRLSKGTLRLHRLEYRIFRESRARFTGSNRRVLVMSSGGQDSVALLRVLSALKQRLSMELEVLHVHHGPGFNVKARDEAERFMREWCAQQGVVLHLARSQVELRSEAELRGLRLRAMADAWERAKDVGTDFTYVAFAHHRDDLLETRLIRLLRGTGAQGLRAMRPWGLVRGIPVWRPFLTTDRRDLQRYLEECGARAGVDWVDDPSNQDAKYLRNAIRHQLLPQIEAIRQGGVAAITRSLEVIVEEISDGPVEEKVPLEPASPAKLSRRDLMSLSPEKQRARLGQWLKQRGVESYSQAHIKEVLKRLDTDQRRLSFEVCGRVWLVDEMVEIVALPQQGQ